MRKKDGPISNREKLLIVIYKMSLELQCTLKYEDISVRAFKEYPNDFQLRGYSEYPDTEHTSKRLYDLRREGFIQVHSKFIKLTEKGRTFAKRLLGSKTIFSDNSRISKILSRDTKGEIDRIKKTDAFQLFVADKKDQIVDTDFFFYLGTTVRTERANFRARIKTVHDVIEAIKSKDEYKTFVDLHDFLFDRFKGIINTILSIRNPRSKHE